MADCGAEVEVTFAHKRIATRFKRLSYICDDAQNVCARAAIARRDVKMADWEPEVEVNVVHQQIAARFQRLPAYFRPVTIPAYAEVYRVWKWRIVDRK